MLVCNDIYYQYIIWFIILIYHMIYNMKVRVYHFEDKDEVRWNGFRKSVWEFLWMILHQAKVSLDMTKISIGCTLGHAADPKSIWSSHFLPVLVPTPPPPLPDLCWRKSLWPLCHQLVSNFCSALGWKPALGYEHIVSIDIESQTQ